MKLCKQASTDKVPGAGNGAGPGWVSQAGWDGEGALQLQDPHPSQAGMMEDMGGVKEDCLDELFNNFMVSLDPPQQDPVMVSGCGKSGKTGAVGKGSLPSNRR